MSNAFITGSFAYGLPHEESDIDLVVEVGNATIALLDAICKDAETDVELRVRYNTTDGMAIYRFGRLNLIACTSHEVYLAWRHGTNHLKEQKPVSREASVELFERLFAEVRIEL